MNEHRDQNRRFWDDGIDVWLPRRKNHPRVEACGAIDELNAALGMVRATTTENFVGENLLAIQKDLIVLMGELGVQPEDLKRYFDDGYLPVAPEMTAKLEALVGEIESQNVSFKGWATPGATKHSAALDMARTVCRRAERSRLRAEVYRRAAEHGNFDLSQPFVRFALAFRALGGSEKRRLIFYGLCGDNGTRLNFNNADVRQPLKPL